MQWSSRLLIGSTALAISKVRLMIVIPGHKLQASSNKHATLCQMFFMFGCGSLFLLLLIGNRRRVRLNACSSNDGLVRCYGLLDVRT